MNTIPFPVYYKNRQEGIVHCNKSFEQLIGQTATELKHNRQLCMNHPILGQLQEKERDVLSEKRESKVNEMELVIDGKPKVLNIECIPVIQRNHMKGMIGVVNDITHQKLREQELNDKYMHDKLTGVLNRHGMKETKKILLNEAVNSKRPITVIFADIDNFKSYNDTYGHMQGDWCLREVAQRIKASLMMPLDIVVRYGGEEFLVVLMEVDYEKACEVGERIRKNVFDMEIPHEASNAGVVTISLGVCAGIPSSIDDFEKMLECSDKMLYIAKKRGRNRAECNKW